MVKKEKDAAALTTSEMAGKKQNSSSPSSEGKNLLVRTGPKKKKVDRWKCKSLPSQRNRLGVLTKGRIRNTPAIKKIGEWT